MPKSTAKPDTLGIAELAANLAEAQDLSKARSKSILDGVRDHIVETLLAGNRVNLFGLGTFEVRATKEKMGRNPKTGEEYPITARRVLTFRPSPRLIAAVNGEENLEDEPVLGRILSRISV